MSKDKKNSDLPKSLNNPFAAALRGKKAPKQADVEKKKQKASAGRAAKSGGASSPRRDSQPAEKAKPEKREYQERVARTQAYRGVAPLSGGQEKKKVAAAPVRKEAPSGERLLSEAAARARLDSLVGGAEKFSIEKSGDLLRGLRKGAHVSQLSQLPSLPIDAELDLHGLRAEVAKKRLREFVRQCDRNRRKTLRVVKGKGRTEIGESNPLEDVVIDTLSSGVCAAIVDAFCYAPLRDGGRGVILVRLRG